jgi:hypothetical protein
MKIPRQDILEMLPKISKQMAYQNYAYKAIEKEIKKIKEEIIEEFNNHPVTIEIEGGTSASNISGTLNGLTNLYSYIGFDAGYDPLFPIRKELEKINITYAVLNNGAMVYKIDFPSAENIFKITPMPWAEGRSWARGIEQGISGIGYYLKISKNSRSGLGIQSKKQVRSGFRFKNTKYISALINKYKQKIQELEKSTSL